MVTILFSLCPHNIGHGENSIVFYTWVDSELCTGDDSSYTITILCSHPPFTYDLSWDLAECPPGWMFQVKYKADWYWAQLVAKGYCQKLHIDCTETFTPVVKIVEFYTIIAIAADLEFFGHFLCLLEWQPK